MREALGLTAENLKGEENVLEGVKVNGEALTIADKTVDILVAEGSTNGTIAVNNKDVAVHGLGDAAYTTVAALEGTMDAKDQAVATAAATDAQTKANAALDAAKTWVEEQEYVTASIINGLATEKYVDDAVKAEADAARDAEEALGKRIDDLAAAAVSVKEGTINHVKVTKSDTEYTVEGVDIASKSVVDTLIGDDKAMSARAIVQDEVAKQLTSENISDSFDTLKEMAEWLSSHPEDVEEMNDAIGANKTAIEAEVLRATTAEGNLQTAIDNEVSARKAAIAALNATVGNQTVAEGKHVAVEVVETAGKLTGLTIVESDIASAKALATLDAEVQEHEQVVAGALNDLNDRLVAAEGSVANHETRLTTAEGEINALQATVGGLDLGVKTIKGQGGDYVTVTPAEASKGDVTVSVSVATTEATNTAYSNDALATDGYVEEQSAAAVATAAADATSKANTAESNAKTYADNLMSWVVF